MIPKLVTVVRVRFPSPAPTAKAQARDMIPNLGLDRYGTSSGADARQRRMVVVSVRPVVTQVGFPAVVRDIVMDNERGPEALGENVVPFIPHLEGAASRSTVGGIIVLPYLVLFDAGLISVVAVAARGAGWLEPDLLVVEVDRGAAWDYDLAPCL